MYNTNKFDENASILKSPYLDLYRTDLRFTDFVTTSCRMTAS